MTSNSTVELDRLLSQALSDIATAKDSAAVEQLRVSLLGRQGAVTAQLKLIGSLPPEERKTFGAAVNRVRDQLTGALSERASAVLAAEREAA
ncbi:MAG TPA: phenylalanine--tRNA ligase subunit alpha, partial [Gammaproteobacteria bacterium]|nr:phenylalanine--tRNA ligase subunit alpha [Gammaproteobacteria bacterium]